MAKTTKKKAPAKKKKTPARGGRVEERARASARAGAKRGPKGASKTPGAPRTTIAKSASSPARGAGSKKKSAPAKRATSTKGSPSVARPKTASKNAAAPKPAARPPGAPKRSTLVLPSGEILVHHRKKRTIPLPPPPKTRAQLAEERARRDAERQRAREEREAERKRDAERRERERADERVRREEERAREAKRRAAEREKKLAEEAAERLRVAEARASEKQELLKERERQRELAARRVAEEREARAAERERERQRAREAAEKAKQLALVAAALRKAEEEAERRAKHQAALEDKARKAREKEAERARKEAERVAAKESKGFERLERQRLEQERRESERRERATVSEVARVIDDFEKDETKTLGARAVDLFTGFVRAFGARVDVVVAETHFGEPTPPSALVELVRAGEMRAASFGRRFAEFGFSWAFPGESSSEVALRLGTPEELGVFLRDLPEAVRALVGDENAKRRLRAQGAPRWTSPAEAIAVLEERGVPPKVGRPLVELLRGDVRLLLDEEATAEGRRRAALRARAAAEERGSAEVDIALLLARNGGPVRKRAELAGALEAHSSFLADGGGGQAFVPSIEAGLPNARYDRAGEDERQADFALENLCGEKFVGDLLAFANLTGIRAEKTNFSRADLTGATVRFAYAKAAVFAGANLTGADFSETYLVGADFRKADLTEVNFEGADLREADFGGAITSGTRFSGANVRGIKY